MAIFLSEQAIQEDILIKVAARFGSQGGTLVGEEALEGQKGRPSPKGRGELQTPPGSRPSGGGVYFLSFSRSRISVNSCSSLLGSGGAAGASSSFLFRLLMALIAIKMAKAMMVKSNMVWMNLP